MVVGSRCKSSSSRRRCSREISLPRRKLWSFCGFFCIILFRFQTTLLPPQDFQIQANLNAKLSSILPLESQLRLQHLKLKPLLLVIGRSQFELMLSSLFLSIRRCILPQPNNEYKPYQLANHYEAVHSGVGD